MKKHSKLTALLLIFSLTLVRPVFSAESLLLYAAASTSNAFSEIIKKFNSSQNSIKVKASFASSSTLAKQIQAGAPAHLFISANPKWMDFLEQQKLIIPETRSNLLHNKIVLITPSSKPIQVSMTKDFDFDKQLHGRLCLGDPDHVPAGIYAKQAFKSLGWWKVLKPKLVGTVDVRAALALVEQGECHAGVVYSTDAIASKKVNVIAEFPDKTHEPIVYPMARTIASSDSISTFIDFLQSPQSQDIFKKYGFIMHNR